MNKIKQQKIILSILYLFVFTALNYIIYYSIFKAPWLTPGVFFDKHLDLAFHFLTIMIPVIGCLILCTYPSIQLSHNIVSKFFNIKEKEKEKLPMIIKILSLILFLMIFLFAGYATYGVAFLIIPTTAIIFVEYYILLFLSSFLLKFTKNLNFFIFELTIISFFLALIFGILFYVSPIRNCRTNEHRCIAVNAAKNNNPKLCEKVGSFSSSSECYEFLAAANDNPCFCEFAEEEQKELCYKFSYHNDFDLYKNSIGLSYYKKELMDAKFKDLSILNDLNCKNKETKELKKPEENETIIFKRNQFIIDFKKCQDTRTLGDVYVNSTRIEITDKKNNNCSIKFGTKVEMGDTDWIECVVPVDIGAVTFSLDEYGLNLDVIKKYCK